MGSVSLSKENNSIIVFHVWKSLPYKLRMMISFFLIVVGLIIQYYGSLYLGLLFVLGGNMLTLVKGYDNRIKLGMYSATGEWVKTDKEHLDQIVEMNKKVNKLKSSFLDISSKGAFLFIVLVFVLVVLISIAFDQNNYYLKMMVFNTAILFLPHWFTGLNQFTDTPYLVRKILIYKKVLKEYDTDLQNKKVSFMIFVKGKDDKLPSDVKMKIDFENQTDNFLGLYAQIAANSIQGKFYPYFYMVMVAKEQMKMTDKYFNQLEVSKPIIKEKSKENNLDIIIIRQHTTKTSGYYTTPKRVNKIFTTGLAAAEFILNNEI